MSPPHSTENRGASLSFQTSVQSGANSAVPHHNPSGRKLESGDLVLFDFGAAFEGYCADLTRMAVVGEPTNCQILEPTSLRT